MRRICVLLTALMALAAVPIVPSTAAPRLGRPTVAQDRSVEAVVVPGSSFAGWSAGPDVTAREPQAPTDPLGTSDCEDRHSCYESSRIPNNPGEGVPVDRLIGYRWDDGTFIEIPLQVDERFTRYLSNNASGFAFYSGVDQHTTYAFDREGFRFTANDPDDLCLATMPDGVEAAVDPIAGLDDNDEVALLWRDTGDPAPVGAGLPDGITEMRAIRIDDPSDRPHRPSAGKGRSAPGESRFAYVGLASPDGPRPSFDSSNGYVRYERDLDADMFVFSQSSYRDYGNAPKGPYCDEQGNLVLDADGNPRIEQRRPKDKAWIRTPRYAFRYDGRWLMTEMRVNPDQDATEPAALDAYGADLVDHWKARAFQLRPGGQTPCCGYEEEVNNWGGSSILMGERSGPVRVIRETWGADSATNNIRREVFYPDYVSLEVNLRVHPIPPADGIYAMWDHNAGVIDTYYNPANPDGVAVDGRNDEEVFGNLFVHAAPDQVGVRTDDDMPVLGPTSASVPLGGSYDGCRIQGERGFCNDMDLPDPTHSGPAGQLDWEQLSGAEGTLVFRQTVSDHTPGGTAQSLVAVPYYRDDSCFDDGTGSDPGPHLNGRNTDEQEPYNSWTDPETGETRSRECWTPGEPTGDRRWWQGSIGTHGVHLLFVAESDNAGMTLPLTEINSEQRIVALPGHPGNVGEAYGRWPEYELRTTVTPAL